MKVTLPSVFDHTNEQVRDSRLNSSTLRCPTPGYSTCAFRNVVRLRLPSEIHVLVPEWIVPERVLCPRRCLIGETGSRIDVDDVISRTRPLRTLRT